MNINFLNDVDIPIERQNVIEYQLAEYCSFIYDVDTEKEYLWYIDLVSGDEYEEDLIYFKDACINNLLITCEDLETFRELIPEARSTTLYDHFL